MQLQLNVTVEQKYSDYAEHLINYVVCNSRKNREEAIKYLDMFAGRYWWCKQAEFKQFENLED